MTIALRVAEHILTAIAALNSPHSGSPIKFVTVSIGIAVAYPALGEPKALLVKQAGRARYDAKRTGRHRGVRSGRV
jgi:PleD family two-component response regulator